MQMLLADSCFNITHDSFMNDLDETIQRAESHEVKYFFAPAARESEIENLLHHCKVYEGKIYCSIGIHPHYASELKPNTIANLKPHLKNKYVRSIGEVGLDYFRNFQSPEIQIKCFETFVELAIEENYPLFLHHREAFNDFYPIVKNSIHKLPQSIVHCFTGNKNELKKFLDLGLFIGVTGWVCDPKRGQELREIIKYIPIDRMVLETDAPYLLPKDIESKPKNNRNEPMFLEHILSVVSTIIKADKKIVAHQTTNNFKRLFRL